MGFKVIESKANFIFISHPKINGRLLFEKYKETISWFGILTAEN